MDNIQAVIEKIRDARYDFYSDQFEQVSQEAKDFIAALLQKAPEYRMSARCALQHTWIKVGGDTCMFFIQIHVVMFAMIMKWTYMYYIYVYSNCLMMKVNPSLLQMLERVAVGSASPWPMVRLDVSRLRSFNARRKWHVSFHVYLPASYIRITNCLFMKFM